MQSGEYCAVFDEPLILADGCLPFWSAANEEFIPSLLACVLLIVVSASASFGDTLSVRAGSNFGSMLPVADDMSALGGF